MKITRNLRFAVLGIIIMLFVVSCPSNPNTQESKKGTGRFSPNAQRLMNFLEDQYGKQIISGQMDTSWTTNGQMDMISRVYADTGKYPAIKGFDFIQLPFNYGQHDYGKQQVDEAVEWWEGKNRVNNANVISLAKLLPDQPDIHGIVTFCWHWRRPATTGTTPDFYTRNTDFRIPWKDGKLDTASADFRSLKDDLDKVAALLKLLKDQDIPVLWRPLHEAAGGWFWWGASCPAPCIALWEYMYNYLTDTKGLNNLIWVWNGQNAAWFPNADTVDIVGYDVYTNAATSTSAQNYSSQLQIFTQTREMVPGENRMVALTENGAIPDPAECINDGAVWLWFMTWNDRSGSTQGETHKDNFWTGEYHNTQSHKEKIYNHARVITLDKLPDLTKYRLE
jgi:mannan endo-1,4-beta-mannosidase